MATIVENLVVYPDNMRRNMDRTFGLFNSQRLLLKLIDTGLSREEAYAIVQPRAMQAWEEQRSFRDIVEEDEAITSRLSADAIEDAFDIDFHTRRVDEIFERVGIG